MEPQFDSRADMVAPSTIFVMRRGFWSMAAMTTGTWSGTLGKQGTVAIKRRAMIMAIIGKETNSRCEHAGGARTHAVFTKASWARKTPIRADRRWKFGPKFISVVEICLTVLSGCEMFPSFRDLFMAHKQ